MTEWFFLDVLSQKAIMLHFKLVMNIYFRLFPLIKKMVVCFHVYVKLNSIRAIQWIWDKLFHIWDFIGFWESLQRHFNLYTILNKPEIKKVRACHSFKIFYFWNSVFLNLPHKSFIFHSIKSSSIKEEYRQGQ